MENTMTKINADKIIEAIDAGFAAGGRDEWDAPEFQAARDLTEQAGCVWDFTGWRETRQTVQNHSALGGVVLDVPLPDSTIERYYESGRASARGDAYGSADDTPREAAERDGLTDIRSFDTHGNLGRNVIGRDRRGHLIAICDLDGPWAIDITNEREIELEVETRGGAY
jgi:hypothetical protein